ncbi:GNAT family N-acetyltransferase [Actinokineospora xionganensis]|uniref:GNAT family N-acetyltransferase n=1 Tax=Actinokineospora xionganensis TaxID=2684470 RepID=UPI0028B14430|nr:GNAT family N-acetyltransferase [Actinokineospora xionganensis]
MDPAAIIAEHAARVGASDPLLPAPADFRAGTRLSVDGGEAVTWFQHLPVGLAARSWEPARTHRMDVRLAGDDRATVLGALLDQWLESIRDTVAPGDKDSAAVIELPSRDTEAVSALVHRGFVPCSVLAVRKACRGGPPGDPGVRVRAATAADLAVATELNLAVVRFDAPFGKITPRESTAEVLRNQLLFLLGQPEPLVWLAERAGRVVGMVHIQLPPVSNWASGYVAASATGYLGCLGVVESERGGGVGAALAAHAHAVIDAAGPPVTLLHHALANPYSTPFWYAMGYRPLWTTWIRRPTF